MSDGKQIPIDIKTTADTSGLNQVTKGLDDVKAAANDAGQSSSGIDAVDQAIARMDAAAEDAIKRIDALDESNAALAPGLADVAKQAGEAEKAIDDTKKAVQEHGEKSEQATQKMMAMGQISQGLAMGLNNLADVARANGQVELANDLNKVSAAMSAIVPIASMGMGLHAAIAAAGGMQAALIGLRTAAIASLAAFGPYLAALAAGAALYYGLQKAADAYMGTVEEMDAKNERAAIAIGGVTVSHEEEKEARDRAKESIDKYKDALEGANDELERNLELAGNQEQLAKARINADIRKRQADVDAQAAAFERTDGNQGISPEQAIIETQRLNEEKLRRTTAAEEQQRLSEEQALAAANRRRAKELEDLRTENTANNDGIKGTEGRFNLSAEERKQLSAKAKEVEAARQKYGADSDEVASAMQEYTAMAVKMNDEEKADLLRRLTLREELSKKIEAAAADLDALEKKLLKTQRDNNQERAVTQVETEGEVVTTRTQSETRIEEERARQQAAKKAAAERADREKITGMEDDLDRTAAGNRDQLLGTNQARSGPKAKELQAIAKQIADADSTEEIKAIADRFNNMSGGTVEMIRMMLAVQERQAKEIENMKARLKKL